MAEIEQDVVELIVERVTERLSPHLDALERRMAALEQSIDVNATDIKHDTQFTRVLAREVIKLLGSPDRPETPDDDTPPPINIGRATKTRHGKGPQRVDLDQYGAVMLVLPETDTGEAWDEVKTNLRRERGAQ